MQADPHYNRARTWIKRNMDPGSYKTLEEFLKDIQSQPGFKNIKKMDKLNKELFGDYDGKFVFKSEDDLKKEIDKYLNIAEMLKRAKDNQDVKKALEKAREVRQASEDEVLSKIRPVERVEEVGPVETIRKKVSGVIESVGNFFKGLFKRR